MYATSQSLCMAMRSTQQLKKFASFAGLLGQSTRKIRNRQKKFYLRHPIRSLSNRALKLHPFILYSWFSARFIRDSSPIPLPLAPSDPPLISYIIQPHARHRQPTLPLIAPLLPFLFTLLRYSAPSLPHSSTTTHTQYHGSDHAAYLLGPAGGGFEPL